jgi:hypothetical protein
LRSSGATFKQTVSATFGDPIALQMIGAIRGYCIAEQRVSFGCGYCIAEQRVGFGGGEGIQCKNRESDTEDSLAFHDDVLRVAVVGYGADLTPHHGYENFIDLMDVIDAINSWSSMSRCWIDLHAVAYVIKRNALQVESIKPKIPFLTVFAHKKRPASVETETGLFPLRRPYFKSSK